MSSSSSVFPFAHIALAAVITAGVAFLLLVALHRRFKAYSLVDCLLVAVVVGHAAHRVEVGGQYRGPEQRPHFRGESQRCAVSPGELSVHRLLRCLSTSCRYHPHRTSSYFVGKAVDGTRRRTFP